MVKQRIIALVDCDSFFVSCEQKRNPSLKGKPVCVISNSQGCVISRSKEAKAMGIKMGEPLFIAQKDHPLGIYIVADHEYYSNVSAQVMAVLKDFSPYVQIYSVDEAFVDFTGLKRLYKMNYARLAMFLRNKILNELDIPVSVGVSLSKTLAKFASEKAKKSDSGIFLIGKRKIHRVLNYANIEDIWGIGSRLSKRLKSSGVLRAGELIEKSDSWLDKQIGIHGIELKHELSGELVSAVVNSEEVPKSIQNSRAFGIFTNNINYIKNELNRHIHTSCRKLRSYNTKCSQVGVMLRTKDFRVFFEKKLLLSPSDFELEISKVAIDLLEDIYDSSVLYRAVGIVLDRIGEQGTQQLSLYEDDEITRKKEKLTKCFDGLEKRFGKNVIKTGFHNKT